MHFTKIKTKLSRYTITHTITLSQLRKQSLCPRLLKNNLIISYFVPTSLLLHTIVEQNPTKTRV